MTDEDAEWLPPHTPEAAGVSAPVESSQVALPQIIVGSRELRDEANDCLAVLHAVNDPPRWFVQSDRMFEVVANEKGRQVGREVTEAGLRGCLTRNADFRKKTGKGLVPCFPPLDIPKDILALAPGELGFPVLDGITGVPVIRPDGSIVDTPGYDRPSRLFYSPEAGFQLPAIAEYPSSDHLDVAKGLIDEMLDGFPFADPSSRANGIGGLLTPVLRSAIEGATPVLVVSAPQAATGKTLFAELIALISTGEPAEMCSMPRDDSEMQKLLTTLIQSMTPVVVFDNVMRRVDNADFAKAVTETLHSDREFRTHQKRVSSVRTTWVLTGNNVRTGGDMPRRCFWVVLDAKTSRPELRSDFKIADLRGWVRERRPALLAALLTLARAWYAAGKPAARLRPLGSFESWSATIGGILEHAGISGFLGNASELREEADAEAAQWERFLQVLRDVFGQPFSVADLKKKMGERVGNVLGGIEPSSEAEELRRALPDYLAEFVDRPGSFQCRAGNLFAKHCGRRFGKSEIYLDRAGISHHAQMWVVGSGTGSLGELPGS